MKKFLKKCGAVGITIVSVMGVILANFSMNACIKCGISACAEVVECKYETKSDKK
ncbi:hypothetical protein FACS189465_2110 [Clostridia bacterium]|nr:hypothetical protein FACS189465_2110 [Clostridia bacterium]